MLLPAMSHSLQLLLIFWMGQVAASGMHCSTNPLPFQPYELDLGYNRPHPVPISQLDLPRFVDCVEAAFGKRSPVRYSVCHRALNLWMAVEDYVPATDEGNDRFDDCNHAVHGNATIFDSIQFSSSDNPPVTRPIGEASSDTELVGTTWSPGPDGRWGEEFSSSGAIHLGPWHTDCLTAQTYSYRWYSKSCVRLRLEHDHFGEVGH